MSKIMIVDDSMVDRRIMTKIIEKNIPDAIIIESDNGIGVEARMRNENIDLCILDLRMPERSGLEILAAIKDNVATMDIPVIVCTGLHETKTLKEVLTLGAYDYFTKPLSEEVMKIALPLKVKNGIELMQRTRHIVHLSEIDGLTGLYNRDYFKRFLLSYKAPLGLIMMIDINGLKVINDAFGNDFGDRYMIHIAELVRDNAPDDAICARWGGDEFAIFFPNGDKILAENFGKDIRFAFSQLQQGELKLSLAFGWEIQSKSEVDYLGLLTKAEDSMIRDKMLENESTRSSMIGAILHTLHEKNPREEAHSRRVSELCHALGTALELSEKELKDLKVIGLLHDIGKIAIDENILNKPARLTHDEWQDIRRHPEIGHRILSGAPEMRDYANVILCHHERIDGKGYPNGLMGDEIPLYSKMLTIIDSYDAMTCERPYKTSLTDEEAIEELRRHSGTQFDEALVKLFELKVKR